MKDQYISRVDLDDRGLYFVCDSGVRSGRFMECIVEYDEESEKWVLRANDHIVAEF